MKRFILFSCLIIAGFQGLGQQDVLYSQYMFNPFAINPAYAGTRNSFSGVLLHRSQWVGVPGAPRTQSLAVHAPVNKYKIAWGINLMNDRLGPTRNVLAAGTIGYHLKMSKSTLSFALRAGMVNTFLNRSELNFKDETDQFNGSGNVNSVVPTIDFGLYFYQSRFFAGFNVNHLTKHQFDFDGFPDSENLFFRKHYNLSAGYVFDIKKNLKFKPSFLLRVTENSPGSLDINVNFLLYEKLWLGLSVRSQNSIVVLFDFNVSDFFRIGYALDLNYTELGVHGKTSHEILLGFDFNFRKNEVKSPRYL